MEQEKMTLESFSAWAGPRNPRMLIIGEAWGENEQQVRQPFVGTSGLELWRILGESLPDIEPQLHSSCLKLAYRIGNGWVRQRSRWLEAASIAYTNVFNLRPPSNDLGALCAPKKDLPGGYSLPPLARALYLHPDHLPEVRRLYEEIDASRPNIIVAAGNTACWACLCATNISAIRGAVAPSHWLHHEGLPHRIADRKILPTYHPAAVLRQWNWRPITVADFIKAAKEAASPEIVRPERFVTISPSLEEVLDWTRQTLAKPPPLLACDIETIWQQIRCIGFARSRANALVIPFVDTAHASGSYWPTPGAELTAWSAVRSLLASPIPKLFQNGVYDVQYLIHRGLYVANMAEDTMLLHHALYPEMRKGLGFLGSIYSNESSWKLMSRPHADTTKRDE